MNGTYQREPGSGSSRSEHSSSSRAPRELDWNSISGIKLPRPPFRRAQWPRQQKLATRTEWFQVQGTGLRLESVEKLPFAQRPDPAFRRFHPIASGLLMLDDLGNAQGFGDSQAAILRYDRAGQLVVQAGLSHQLYRLGVHPLGREFMAMSSDCIAYAYDDDLRPLWQASLADSAPMKSLRQRFPIADEWLRNHIRCVAWSRDRSRYLFAAVDELWCFDVRGEVLWGLKLPLRNQSTRFVIRAGASTEIRSALSLLELSFPVTPLQIKRRYRELAMRWHPDRNGSALANHQQMAALNSAYRLLSILDIGILSGGGSGTGLPVSSSFGFGDRFDRDWIYAADFAGDSNQVYLASYSGRVVSLDIEGRPREIYELAVTPVRIIDTGEFQYIFTYAALYVLRHGLFEAMVEPLDGGELVMAHNGFGLLETKRLRWYSPQGGLLGTIVSADPIRRIYQASQRVVIESRLRRASVSGLPPWF